MDSTYRPCPYCDNKTANPSGICDSCEEHWSKRARELSPWFSFPDRPVAPVKDAEFAQDQEEGGSDHGHQIVSKIFIEIGAAVTVGVIAALVYFVVVVL